MGKIKRISCLIILFVVIVIASGCSSGAASGKGDYFPPTINAHKSEEAGRIILNPPLPR